MYKINKIILKSIQNHQQRKEGQGKEGRCQLGPSNLHGVHLFPPGYASQELLLVIRSSFLLSLLALPFKPSSHSCFAHQGLALALKTLSHSCFSPYFLGLPLKPSSHSCFTPQAFVSLFLCPSNSCFTSQTSSFSLHYLVRLLHHPSSFFVPLLLLSRILHHLSIFQVVIPTDHHVID